MTCRHSAGDPNCSSTKGGFYDTSPKTPDSSNYDVIDAEEVGPHLIMKVKYSSCTDCAFEGLKVMVFLDTRMRDALRWKKIDPHFRAPKQKHLIQNEAPPPAARFPGDPTGWSDAREYAKRKAEDSKLSNSDLEQLVRVR